MIASIHNCPIHNCPMLIRYCHPNTPRQSFDGLVCPQCEAREEKAQELPRAINQTVSDCSAFLRALKRAEPFGFDRLTWEEREAWYARFVKQTGARILGGVC